MTDPQVSLSGANSFLRLQLPRSRKRAKKKKEGKWVETLSAPGGRGHGWEFAHGAAGLAAGAIRAAGETHPSRCYPPPRLKIGAFQQGKVPSHTGLCHPLVWELESTSNPDVCCTCDSLLTKEKKKYSEKAKQIELLAAAALAHLTHTCNKSKLAESFPFHPNKTNNKQGLKAKSGVFGSV